MICCLVWRAMTSSAGRKIKILSEVAMVKIQCTGILVAPSPLVLLADKTKYAAVRATIWCLAMKVRISLTARLGTILFTAARMRTVCSAVLGMIGCLEMGGMIL